MIRFHLDEHVHPGIALGLRSHGIDVTTTVEAGLRGAGDRRQVEFARSQHRVIVTHDDDFLKMHAQGVEHAGILYCHQGKYKVGELLQMLMLVHDCDSAQDLQGVLQYL